jgi:hypothetical protein
MVNRNHILLILAFLAVGVTAEERKTYDGVWEGKFKDSIFCVLRIEAGDKLTGTLSAGDIRLNEDGELVEAAGSEKDYPILNPKLYADRLTFDWKDESDDPVVKFEMRLTGDSKADLRLIFAGYPNIKPWPLTKK